MLLFTHLVGSVGLDSVPIAAGKVDAARANHRAQRNASN